MIEDLCADVRVFNIFGASSLECFNACKELEELMRRVLAELGVLIARTKQLTIDVCEAIEENYSRIVVVFRGRRGFYIHVLASTFELGLCTTGSKYT